MVAWPLGVGWTPFGDTDTIHGTWSQRLGPDTVTRSSVEEVTSRRADCGVPLVIQEASHHWRA